MIMSSDKGMLPLLLACLLVCSALVGNVLAVPASDNKPLLHMERVGIPFPAWTSPTHGTLNASTLCRNPHLTRGSHLAPRFHRMLRYGQDPTSKTQTAIFLVGRSQDDEELGRPGASIISALNPRNGEIVWRSIRNETDPIHSMHLASDVILTLSGIDQTRATLTHALTGTFLWSSPLVSSSAAVHTGLVDAALIPPAYLHNAASSSVPALAPDVIAMDRAGAVTRFAGVNGAVVWSHVALSEHHDSEESSDTIIPLKLHSDRKHTIVVSLVPHLSRSRLFSTSETYSLRLTVLSASTGAHLTTFDIPGSNVEMTHVFAEHDTTSNVALVGRDADGGNDRPPHVVWLQKDGTIKSLSIPLPAEPKQVLVETSSIRTLKPKTANRFNALAEIITLRNRGVLIGRTDNARAEVLRISKADKHMISFWEMEEEAPDSVFAGGSDRQGKPYLNRVFFGRSQHLLNFHTLWVDSYDEQGQVTGASFQWDHDLNGDVLAAPFEVSPVSEFQVVWRAAFVTRSASVRMLQDERHQWIREEGLSHTIASIMIDLPESKTGTGDAASDARTILEGENFVHRVQRHAIALQSLPTWTLATLLQMMREVPNLSLESFGIMPPRAAHKFAPKAASKGTANKPVATNAGGGAAPLPGVGAQKVGSGVSPARRKPPPGVPMPGARKTRPPQDEGIPPPTHMAPREANATVTSALVRDAFGFRKLIVAISKSGKIYAIDSKTGSFVWEKSLFGFGQGEGASVPTVDVKMLALVRPLAGSGVDISTPSVQVIDEAAAHVSTSQLDHGGLLTVVATVHDEGATFTRMWEIEPLTGRVPGGVDSQTGLALFPGEPKDAFLLPVEDENSGQIAAVAVSQHDKILIWPTTASIQARFLEMGAKFFYAVHERIGAPPRDVLAGYTPVSRVELQGQKAWQMPLPEDETIVSITRPSRDSIASQGKVLGNRRTLYKYLNPHLLMVITKNVARRGAAVYIVDGITGKIVHHSLLADGNLSLASPEDGQTEPIAVFTENWATIVFDVEIAADDVQARYKGAHRQTRLISIELYDDVRTNENETWKWKGLFSSFATKIEKAGYSGGPGTTLSAVDVYSQLYVVPYGVRGMAATRTKLGVSSKAIVLATDQNRLQILPRRLLDPRRPMGRKPTTSEMEEGLMTYDPVLLDSGTFQLGGRSVPMPRRIRTKATQLESTSVVFVDQSLDYFVTTVAPSGSFDRLSASFNKLQLLLTMAVLTVGLFVTKPMVASKMLRMRWQSIA